MIDQGEFFEIPNPCKKICVANNKGYCKGCFRSREERQNWYNFSEFQRHLVVQACEGRKRRVLAAKHAKDHPEAEFDIEAVQDDLFEAKVEPNKSEEPTESTKPTEPIKPQEQKSEVLPASEIPPSTQETNPQRTSNETLSRIVQKPQTKPSSQTNSASKPPTDDQLDLF